MSGFTISVRPLFETLGGLTAEPGPLCAYVEHESIRSAMTIAGARTEAWLEAEPEGDQEAVLPIAFNVNVEVKP